MTISYSYDISSSRYFTFLKIVLRWRGSIWKSVWQELVVWTVGYYIVFFIYRKLLSTEQQEIFERFADYTDNHLKYIPLEFILSFFVKTIVDRWSKMFHTIGFVDNPAHFIGAYVRGTDPETKTMRRNMARYLCLTQVLVLRDISINVRKRFPNLDAVVDAGFLLPHEKEMLEKKAGAVENEFEKYWAPMNWVFAGCYRLRAQGKIIGDSLLDGLFGELRSYHDKLQHFCDYDWVPIPLAYSQTVFMAVRVYFFLCVFSRQQHIVKDPAKELDVYIPFMTMLQVVFYLGWLKVAEALINPLGEDDDDFECNYIIDRNIAVAIAITDECYDELPEQRRDNFPSEGGEIVPMYSEESMDFPIRPLIGSASREAIKRGDPEGSKRVTMVRRVTTKPSASGQGEYKPKSKRFFSAPSSIRKSFKQWWKDKDRISEKDEDPQTLNNNTHRPGGTTNANITAAFNADEMTKNTHGPETETITNIASVISANDKTKDVSPSWIGRPWNWRK